MKANVTNIVNTIIEDEVDAGKLARQFEVEVEAGGKLTLPASFGSEFRPTLIRRAVLASRANRRQAYGSLRHRGKLRPMPGMRHSVEWWGKGRGVARIMRITGMSRGAEDPRTRGGRRAHGPKVEKDWSQKMNQKERNLARDSALAATTSTEMVSDRGHRFEPDLVLPIILGEYTEVYEDTKTSYDIEQLDLEHGTRKVVAIFEGLGLGDDLYRAKNGRKIRAGKGKMRGRRFRTPKSILLVVAAKAGLAKAARNLPGIDVVAVRDLSAEDLAPGGDAGRLTVFTKSAITAMEASA